VHGTAEGRSRLDLQTIELTGEQAALKRRAAELYGSQFSLLCDLYPVLRTPDSFVHEWMSQPLTAGPGT
jgi:hypothetical protein